MQTNFLSQFGKQIVAVLRLWPLVEIELKKFRLRVHRFKRDEFGRTFVLEPSIQDGGSFAMTGYGYEIHRGDYIAIQDLQGIVEYLVMDVHFYENTPDVWIAKLSPVFLRN